jgi:hypothetical protein
MSDDFDEESLTKVRGSAGPALEDPLSAGQKLIVIKYGHYYDPIANAYAGPLHLVGSEVTFVERAGSYLVVRDERGEQGYMHGTDLSAADHRIYFDVDGRNLKGYLVAGMYEDHSGGSLFHLHLAEVEGLGTIELDARILSSIAIPSAEQPIEVRTQDGEVYKGRPVRLWLVCPKLKLHLDKAAGIRLTRAA